MNKAQYGQKRLVWGQKDPYHISNSSEFSYICIYLYDVPPLFWAVPGIQRWPNRPADENNNWIRTTRITFWFTFDEETANKSVAGSLSITKPESQAVTCYITLV